VSSALRPRWSQHRQLRLGVVTSLTMGASGPNAREGASMAGVRCCGTAPAAATCPAGTTTLTLIVTAMKVQLPTRQGSTPTRTNLSLKRGVMVQLVMAS